MKTHLNYLAVTLMELLVALVILGMITLFLVSIHSFTYFHTVTTSRRSQIQNEVSYVLEHMHKHISQAIGNERIFGANTVIDIGEAIYNETSRVKVYIDASQDGIRQDPLNNPLANQDHWIAYRFHDGGQRLYRISYCDRCSNKRCDNCLTGWEVLSLRANTIVGMAVSKPGGDILNASYLEVGVSSCWDPDGTPFACGTPDNPSITMNTTIPLPSVSTN